MMHDTDSRQTDAAAALLVDLLRKRGWTVTTCESCTGGGISAALVDIPGASDVLRMAFVTYCDQAKMQLAGVRRETLQAYTAVSEQTAREMAEGIRVRANADLSLAATGIAGPGGTEEFPAGLVYLACAAEGKTEVRQYHFAGDRNEVRSQAVYEALQLALRMMKEI